MASYFDYYNEQSCSINKAECLGQVDNGWCCSCSNLMVSLNTYNCLTCELSCFLTLQRFAAREMWSFHRSPSRREPTVYFARPSRLRLHRSALTSLSTGCLAFGNLASGSQNLCLSQQQESTLVSVDGARNVYVTSLQPSSMESNVLR